MSEGVKIFQDIETPSNISMSLYAKRLSEGLKNVVPTMEVSVFEPKAVRYPRMIANMIRRVPLARFYGDEVFISRHILYPLMARYSQGRINHVVGDTANIIPFIDRNRTVVTCHDIQLIADPSTTYAANHKGYRWYVLRKKVMKNAAMVIAISEYTKRDIMKHLDVPEDRIRVVYNAVDPCFREIKDRHELDQLKKTFGLGGNCGRILLSVGINWAHKNIEGIIHALKYVRNRYGDVILVRVGEVFNQSQVKLMRDLGLESAVYQLGRVAPEDLVSLYNLADVTLFPSFYEGFGWPIVESFACGTPVVTSTTSSMPEVAGDAAILVDPKRPEEVGRAAVDILQNADMRNRLIEKGFERAKLFSMEKQAHDTLKVYEEVLREHGETLEDLM